MSMSNEKLEALNLSQEAIEEGKEGLAKLPILGPVTWLYARDPARKFSFMADIDWMLLPPVVLDQCRLYAKEGVPFAYISWAFVNDQIHARLLTGEVKIAPHEWNSGEHLWLIDVVTPFGQRDETLEEVRKAIFPTRAVNAVIANSEGQGGVEVMNWEAYQQSN